MCANHACRLRTGCYRYLAVPLTHQAYSDFKLELIEGHEVCDMYCSLHVGDVVRELADPKKTRIVTR